ncbi:hypothetical protein C8A03DRAFT_45531 [Achaetomium macrosporum]|uniref:WKF domain-containing protein n=1 Tax=Achaetomium macrosporum TaxID=79813 RepID=A0AAN7C6V1_9PEZI|nr:hypothetical protein C8A03DRAFT_45531 [Achaetomium macrosporum]
MSAPRVPAWKRLGLKLKGPASEEAIPSSGGPNAGTKPSAQVPNAHQTRVIGNPASALKRKQPSSASTPNAVSTHTPNKKPRTEEQTAANRGAPSSVRKSVSFADGTKDNTKNKTSEPAKKKAKKRRAKKTADTPRSDFSLEPSLNYLRQWHTARESWKFNKNHQTLLIKYVFDEDKIPSSDISIFYEYIRDLKGFVRTRLRETAAEIRKKDMEAGEGAFPASVKDKESKQKEYEETISRFLKDLQQHQKQPNGTTTNANGKRALDEVEYVIRVGTPEVKQRLLKRIRAEMVLDELSDSDESTTSTTISASTTTTSCSASASGQEAITTADRSRPRSDSSQQPAKRRRLRNVRTDVADDSSSSESESSESESEEGSSSSSSSSSDDDESEDEEMVDVAPDGASSRPSSSSSSESESEEESEGESEGESESGGSSSSEDD